MLVHQLLTENGLGHFYDLSRHPGARRREGRVNEWIYLDEPALQERLLDFTDGRASRITFKIPAIHCVACVWLLENLFRLHPGIGRSQVNFPARTVAVLFDPGKIRLSELVALLVSIGYEPSLTLDELDKRDTPSPSWRKGQYLRIGIAGFALGNIMLMSLPVYFGLDSFSAPLFQRIFGFLSLALALPVVVYSASDYWRAAWLSLRQRMLTLDVPIALGLAALYAQSAFEIGTGHGEGYLDSLVGLVFFLLCGRLFQQKTHDRLAFDRDYKSFFPLSVIRKTAAGEESAALARLNVGDRLILRNGELIPADARLVEGAALIDYSFVTGESEPVAKERGAYLYAGGQQCGGAIEVEMVKPVSQSYLTSLWNHEAFQKDSDHSLDTMTNRYSRRFTRLVIAVAVGAALFWAWSGDAARGLKAFTSVLIVACPCALALAAPFTLGTAQRLLARVQVFLRNVHVLERLAKIDTIVLDKTGTLTSSQARAVSFQGEPLEPVEEAWVRSLARLSTHPYSRRIAHLLHRPANPWPVHSFEEIPGCGLKGWVAGRQIQCGSPRWFQESGYELPEQAEAAGSVVCLALDGQYRGAFILANVLRPETDQLLARLAESYDIALLSGDNERERERFQSLFGAKAPLLFNQSPLDKLGFIRRLQESGKRVMMVGDGLNDAGALKQSEVGVAVVEKAGAFSPASDIILEAGQVAQLQKIIHFSARAVLTVQISFIISALYNAVGIAIAAAGWLSPLLCAVLMPVSSVSVVCFGCGAMVWAARRIGLEPGGRTEGKLLRQEKPAPTPLL